MDEIPMRMKKNLPAICLVALLGACNLGGAEGNGDGNNGPMEPGSDQWPFENKKDQALQGLPTHVYSCWDGTSWLFTFKDNGGLDALLQGDNILLNGSWAQDGDRLTINLPEINFSESSSGHVYKLDELAVFNTPTFECHLISLGLNSQPAAGYFNCPNIHFIEGTGFSHYHFELFTDAGVIMKRYEEITAGDGDTLIYTRTGFYKIQDGFIYMHIAWDDSVSLLFGPLEGDNGFFINQLEPDRGACVAG
jgi:hypothetical protein